jgi:hypothetical protein
MIVPRQDQAVQPTTHDVIFGRGRRYDNHPGNVQFHHIVKNYIYQYATAANRAEKNAVAESIVNNVCVTGRFLKYDECCDGWIIADPDSTRKKVRQALRYRGKGFTTQRRYEIINFIASDLENLQTVSQTNAKERESTNTARPAVSQNTGDAYISDLLSDSFVGNSAYYSSSTGRAYGETKGEMELWQGAPVVVEERGATSSFSCDTAEDKYTNKDKFLSGAPPNKRLHFEVDDDYQQSSCKYRCPSCNWNQELSKAYPGISLEPTPTVRWQQSTTLNPPADILDEVDFLDFDISMWKATEEALTVGDSEGLLCPEDDSDLKTATSHWYPFTAVHTDLADQSPCEHLLTDEEILRAIDCDCAENVQNVWESETG